MPTDTLILNRAVVFGAAVLYWLSVCVQARRVRRHIGRSPNVRPRGLKESILWGGWIFVIVAWLAQPWLGVASGPPGTAIISSCVQPICLPIGIAMMLGGYALTLWCYRAMGDAWRMGVNRSEMTQLVTHGPYRWTRHPIYLAQLIMVTAMVILLPSPLSLITLAVHLLCILIKSADEESHLRTRLGQPYEKYRERTGWLLKFPLKKTVPPPCPRWTGIP